MAKWIVGYSVAAAMIVLGAVSTLISLGVIGSAKHESGVNLGPVLAGLGVALAIVLVSNQRRG